MQPQAPAPPQKPCLLHLHLPKTGGKTLVELIYRYYSTFYESGTRYRAEGGYLIDGIYYYPRDMEEDAYHRNYSADDEVTPPESVQQSMNRPDVRAVSGHFGFGIHRYIDKPTRYITVLREPTERVVSLYYFIRFIKKVKTPVRELITTKGIGLEEFVSAIGYKQADNGQTRRIAGIEPPFGECTTDMLDTAKDNLRHAFAAVGTLDRFDETLRLIAHRLGWPAGNGSAPSYERRNVNPNRPRLSDLPPDTLALIAAHNRLDAELYRYANDLLSEALGRLSD